jgi:hypothetical protein
MAVIYYEKHNCKKLLFTAKFGCNNLSQAIPIAAVKNVMTTFPCYFSNLPSLRHTTITCSPIGLQASTC